MDLIFGDMGVGVLDVVVTIDEDADRVRLLTQTNQNKKETCLFFQEFQRFLERTH